MDICKYMANGLFAIGLYETVCCIFGGSPSIVSGIILIILGFVLFLFIEEV